MSEAPKSIWVWEHTDPETGKPFGYGEWYTEDVGLDGDETEYVRCDELDRLRAENERTMEALGLLDEQLDSHGFSVDGPMRRLISRTRATLQDKGDK